MTKEEALKSGFEIAGMGPESSFVISMISGREADKNMFLTIDIQNLLNENLKLSNYTNGAIENITITALAPYDGKGVNWLERKFFKRKQKKLFIDMVFDKYKQFCEADSKKALQLIAEQTILATEKYMPKIKEINYETFHNDLIKLFSNKNIIN